MKSMCWNWFCVSGWSNNRKFWQVSQSGPGDGTSATTIHSLSRVGKPKFYLDTRSQLFRSIPSSAEQHRKRSAGAGKRKQEKEERYHVAETNRRFALAFWARYPVRSRMFARWNSVLTIFFSILSSIRTDSPSWFTQIVVWRSWVQTWNLLYETANVLPFTVVGDRCRRPGKVGYA